jgi:hypothetical protein
MGSVAFIAEKRISCRNSVGKPERRMKMFSNIAIYVLNS